MSEPTSPTNPVTDAARNAARGAALAAVLLLALTMRAPITAMAPVIDLVSADLNLTPAMAGLLTGVPVLCFAIATPFSAGLVGRFGTAVMGAAALLTVLAGTLLRSSGGLATALAGTVLIGVAITVGNVLLPVVAARDFSSGVAGVTGATTAAMNLGSVATTMGTAPLAALVGWRWALASWGLLAVVGLVAWWHAYGRRRPPDDRTPPAPAHAPDAGPSVLRRPLTWLLAVTFAAQSASYYGLTAWLPSILHDDAGLARGGAGAAAALFQGFGIAGGLLVPLAMRRARTWVVALAVAATWLALPVGLLLAPQGWAVWASLGGVAQAANYVLIFSVIATHAGSPGAAGRMSAVVQTCGYVLAGLAPAVLGAVHGATGGWEAPLALVAGALAVMAVAFLAALARVGRRAAA